MRVMLAATFEKSEDIKFPVLASPKIDGVRATIRQGAVMSRNMKPIPNKKVQEIFGKVELNGMDGELVVGSPSGPDVFRRTTSGVMSFDGDPDVRFWAFDTVTKPEFTFMQRFGGLSDYVRTHNPPLVKVVTHTVMPNWETLMEFERKALEQGYEGVMLRNPQGPYKFGRSTLREGYLVKLKRFVDGEAEVVGWEEQMHNANETVRNPLTGKVERSSHQANQQPTGKLGALIVRDLVTDVKFNIGTGFTNDDRCIMFIHPPSLHGRIAKYRYFPTGSKNKPRFPTFMGWRDPIDA